MRYEHKIKRDEQKAAGVFDGRFKQRVVIDTNIVMVIPTY